MTIKPLSQSFRVYQQTELVEESTIPLLRDREILLGELTSGPQMKGFLKYLVNLWVILADKI